MAVINKLNSLTTVVFVSNAMNFSLVIGLELPKIQDLEGFWPVTLEVRASHLQTRWW